MVIPNVTNADRLDERRPVDGGEQVIERGEHLGQIGQHRFGRVSPRHGCEVDDVGEQHRDVVEPVDDDWELRLAPKEIVSPLPGVDYDKLIASKR